MKKPVPKDMPTDGIVVDGSCRPNPGDVEWQGAELSWYTILFKAGPFPGGTNNVAEYLALAHGLLTTDGLVYSDSMTAISWVKKGRFNANVQSDFLLQKMINARDKMEALGNCAQRVRFWDKHKWGENPADFGYK